ncbi:MAG: hypothetical protein HQM08_12670 [Candidatus Riflebacteria bacterium]|nr:hypothetical protein [Candidatus Riflebacteria bacterium]
MTQELAAELKVFIKTSLGLSGCIEQTILSYEKGPPDLQKNDLFLETVLWFFRSIKDGASFFGLAVLKNTLLYTENFLGVLRKNKTSIEPLQLKAILHSCTFSVNYLKGIQEDNNSIPLEHESSELITELTIELDKLNKKFLLERINSPARASDLPTPGIIPEFFQTAKSIFAEIDHDLKEIENDPSEKINYERTMRSMHVATGLFDLFGLELLSSLSKLAEVTLFYYLKNPESNKISPIYSMKNTLKILRKSVDKIEQNGKIAVIDFIMQ